MNNNFKYSLIVSSITVEEKSVSSYGIECTQNDGVRKCIEDISVDKDEVTRLVKLLNKCKLNPVQLEDVIEDALS